MDEINRVMEGKGHTVHQIMTERSSERMTVS